MHTWFAFLCSVIKPVSIILGCALFTLSCTSFETVAYKAGVAADISQANIPDFIKESRREQKDFRPLYVDAERRAGLISHSPEVKKFQDVERDLDQELNKSSKS
jgi:hypothetical protein